MPEVEGFNKLCSFEGFVTFAQFLRALGLWVLKKRATGANNWTK
jgi:hypothetical protein